MPTPLRPRRHRRSSPLPGVLLVVGVVTALVLGMARLLADPAARVPASAPVAARPPGAPTPVTVLHHWDAARAACWSAGDASCLRRLYAPGSRAGAADLRLLHRWERRGLHVQGMQRQILRVRVLEASQTRLLVRVVDRLASSYAVGTGARQPLPGTVARARVIDLRLLDGQWRVAAVRWA